jgi:hypothetical protein
LLNRCRGLKALPRVRHESRQTANPSLRSVPAAQVPRITSPKEEFWFNFGNDYQLATYQQLAAYWQKLDRESDRMVAGDWQDVGRPSAPDGNRHVARNYKHLTRYREISRRLALAEGLTDEQTQALAREGKAIVWIDGGSKTLHSQRRAMTGSTIVARRAGM